MRVPDPGNPAMYLLKSLKVNPMSLIKLLLMILKRQNETFRLMKQHKIDFESPWRGLKERFKD
jgi:hypothetical protein